MFAEGGGGEGGIEFCEVAGIIDFAAIFIGRAGGDCGEAEAC